LFACILVIASVTACIPPDHHQGETQQPEGRVDPVPPTKERTIASAPPRAPRFAKRLTQGAGVGLQHGFALVVTPQDVDFGLKARPSNPTCRAAQRPAVFRDISVKFTPAFNHLRFQWPVAIVQTPWSEDHWWLLERKGRLLEITGEHTVVFDFAEDEDADDVKPPPIGSQPRLVLDLQDVVYNNAMDAGLLGLAFHPDFENKPYAYIYITVRDERKQIYSQVHRLEVSKDKRAVVFADAKMILEVKQSGREHNGGHMAFGPDGYLYVGFGDGHIHTGMNSQDTTNLLGSIIRLDVDGGDPYAIPPDNPFVGRKGFRPEIYAYGFRNPWRFAFDAASGDLWVGDVGDAKFEEVNRVRAGGNYGWPVWEANNCQWRHRCKHESFEQPLVTYTHEEGRAITGGVVYRGRAIPALTGRYIFSDFASGVFWMVTNDQKTGKPRMQEFAETRIHPASFAEGRDHDVFVIHYSEEHGRIFRMDPAEPPPPENFPALLSKTGCVDPQRPSQAAPGVIPYEVNRPFWSDRAKKGRFFAIPDGSTIKVREDGDWILPGGSVTMKHLWLDGKMGETRLVRRHDDGAWAGYSYAWRDDGSDAELLAGSAVRTFDGQEWVYPSRAQCLLCHTDAANRTLGLEHLQLNRPATFPGNRRAHQLRTFEHIGVFEAPLGDTSTIPRVTAIDEPNVPLHQQARDYLHVNCASCHRPDGTGRARMDLRHGTAWKNTKVCNEEPGIGNIGIDDPVLIAPGQPDRSVLLARMRRRDVHSMPPMGSRLVDTEGLDLITRWIQAMPNCKQARTPSTDP